MSAPPLDLDGCHARITELEAQIRDRDERVIPTLLGRIEGLRAGVRASLSVLARETHQALSVRDYTLMGEIDITGTPAAGNLKLLSSENWALFLRLLGALQGDHGP